MRIFASIFCMIMLLPAVAFAVAPSRERSDLKEALQQIVCREGKVPTTQALWTAGIYDAHLDGHILKDGDGLNFARSRAAGLNHAGFASASCGDGRSVAVSVPAIAPLKMSPEKLCIPQEIFSQCRGLSIDFAGAVGGRGRKLGLAHSCADIAALPAGLLSVTCLPKTPRWLGPMALAYVPLKTGPALDVPGAEILSSNGAGEKELGLWINLIRSRERLAPLTFASKPLAESADRLAIGAAAVHDRNSLRMESETLAKSGIKFLGEDRVKGKNLKEAVWQLYNSARHRNLLLNPQANKAALILRESGPDLFVMIVAAAEEPSRVAKAIPASPRRP